MTPSRFPSDPWRGSRGSLEGSNAHRDFDADVPTIAERAQAAADAASIPDTWRVEWDSADRGGWTVFARVGDTLTRHSNHSLKSEADATAERLNADLLGALSDLAAEPANAAALCECGAPLDRFGNCPSARAAAERLAGFPVKAGA